MAPNGCNVLSPLHVFLFKKDMPFRYLCCDEHDLFYEQGGTEQDRKFADKILRDCVKEAGYPVSAYLMYGAVRALGWIFWEYS